MQATPFSNPIPLLFISHFSKAPHLVLFRIFGRHTLCSFVIYTQTCFPFLVNHTLQGHLLRRYESHFAYYYFVVLHCFYHSVYGLRYDILYVSNHFLLSFANRTEGQPFRHHSQWLAQDGPFWMSKAMDPFHWKICVLEGGFLYVMRTRRAVLILFRYTGTVKEYFRQVRFEV